MEQPNIKKKLVIEIDVVDGGISFQNDDELSYLEILGVLEYTKWMVQNDWNDE